MHVQIIKFFNFSIPISEKYDNQTVFVDTLF